MKTIKLNERITIDLNRLIDTKLLIQANSGGGKSFTIRRLLEQSHGKVQQIIIDPEGEFASLREKYEYILCGKGQDAPAEPRSAALLAKRLLELGTSAIIDLYELHPQERKHFVRLFLEAMVNAPKELWHPVLVVIDEAHAFAPEKGESEALNAVIGLCSLGRKRQFGAVLATQRISKLHKDAAAECNNKLIGRTGLDIDRKRAAEEIGFTSKEDVLSLRNLTPGEFYCFGPAISMEVIREKVGEVQTSHSVVGRKSTKVAPPTEKIKRLLGKLADLPQEARQEAQTVAELKKEVAELKRMNTNLLKHPFQKDITPEEIARMARPLLEQQKREYEETFFNLVNEIKPAKKLVDEMFEMMMRKVKHPLNAVIFTGSIPIKKIVPGKILKPSATTQSVSFNKEVGNTDSFDEAVVSKGEMKMLTAIAQFADGVTREHLAVLTGYKATSRRVYLQCLKQKGLIEYSGDNILPTQAGIDALGDRYEVLPTGEALQEHLMQTLPEGEKRVLRVLLEGYPEPVSYEEIEAVTGYKTTSRRVYLQKLSARKLVITGQGSATASSNLFN